MNKSAWGKITHITENTYGEHTEWVKNTLYVCENF
jgi:hypothetical protein